MTAHRRRETWRSRLVEAAQAKTNPDQRWWHCAVVFLAAFPIAWLRLGTAGPRGVVWAEDGSVFLTRAYTSRIDQSLLEPYAGYAHVGPRLIAEIVTWFPLAWQGILLDASAAAIVALIAVVAFTVVGAHSGCRTAGVVAAAAVAAVPVGFEVVDNIANLQWFALPGGLLATLWVPRTVAGRLGQLIAVAGCTLVSPFGVVAALLALALGLLSLRRWALTVGVFAMAGSAVQLGVMLTSQRGKALHSGGSIPDLVEGYLRRVVGDGLLGSARHSQPTDASYAVGLVLFLMLLTALAVIAHARWTKAICPVILLGGSMVLYAVPVLLNASDTTVPSADGRYYVAPVILLVAATVLVSVEALQLARGSATLVLPATTAIGVAVVGGCVIYGLATSWQVPGTDPRRDAAGWSRISSKLDRRCHARTTAISVAVQPHGFSVTIPCSER